MVFLVLHTFMLLGLAFYTWQHRPMRGTRPLFGLTIATAWWALTYALTLSRSNDMGLPVILLNGKESW